MPTGLFEIKKRYLKKMKMLVCLVSFFSADKWPYALERKGYWHCVEMQELRYSYNHHPNLVATLLPLFLLMRTMSKSGNLRHVMAVK